MVGPLLAISYITYKHSGQDPHPAHPEVRKRGMRKPVGASFGTGQRRRTIVANNQIEAKEIRLTATGREAAQSLLRRHMLSELLLARILDVPWSQVHQEADAMEHTISSETVERLAAKLDHPETCPHGNPLPGYEDQITDLLPLSEARAGQRLIIRRVHESAEEQPELMAYMEQQGLLPGAEVTVQEIMTFNETINLECQGQTIVLGLAPAACVYAEPVN